MMLMTLKFGGRDFCVILHSFLGGGGDEKLHIVHKQIKQQSKMIRGVILAISDSHNQKSSLIF